MKNKGSTNKNYEISTPRKLGYGIGTAGDSISYTIFFTYFIFFLTDVIGVHPAMAGAIASVTMVCYAFAGPIIGYWSDNSKNPRGRRRPFMIGSMFPLAIVAAFLFFPVGLSGALQGAYYLVMAIILWVCYALYVGPWGALGAELTQDYTERNIIRLCVGICASPCLMMAQSGTIGGVSVFQANGFPAGQSWFFSVSICASIMLVLCFVSWMTTKGKEKIIPEDTGVKFKFSFPDLFRQYASFLKIKSYRTLIFFQFIYLIGYTLIMNNTVYSLSHLAGLSESDQSVFWLVYSLVAVASLPIVTAIANKIDKKTCIMFFSIVFIADCILFFTIGITSFATAYIYAIGVAFATSSFWGVFYSLIYDCVELSELVSGERREGGILALSQLAQTLGGALASLIMGFVLSSFGYSGSGIEAETAKTGILLNSTLLPAILTAVSVFLLARYKVNKSRFDAVKQAIEDRKAGIEPKMDDFKDLI